MKVDRSHSCSIVFRRIILMALGLMLLPGITVQAAIILVSGQISADTIWTAGDTVLVAGYLTVASGTELTVNAGAVVLVANGVSITVYGTLQAVGTPNNPVTFSSSADTSGGAPAAGNWVGLYFSDGSAGALSSCAIKYATRPVYCNGAAPSLDYCTISDFSDRGLYFTGGSGFQPAVTNCTIAQTSVSIQGQGTGIYLAGNTDLHLTNTVIDHCSNGLYAYSTRTSAPNVTIINCELSNFTSNGIWFDPG